jgi:hypothetical protein
MKHELKTPKPEQMETQETFEKSSLVSPSFVEA